jgi:hypothetical protein
MKSASMWLAGLIILVVSGTAHAGTVYQWTDENGVRHFSNTGAPPDVGNVDTTDEKLVAPEEEESTAQEAQQEQEEVLSNAPETQEETAEPTLREQVEQIQQERMSRQVEDERQRLQAEIRQIEGRGLGTGFTEGMRAAQLEPLREQLALLESNPEQYFNMKRDGAFTRSGAR